MKDQIDNRLEPSTCVHCASPLVQPTDWARVDDREWEVRIRCPECYKDYAVSLSHDQVSDLSYAVEDGFRCLLDALDELDHEIFEKECEAIINALRTNNLYPMDF